VLPARFAHLPVCSPRSNGSFVRGLSEGFRQLDLLPQHSMLEAAVARDRTYLFNRGEAEMRRPFVYIAFQVAATLLQLTVPAPMASAQEKPPADKPFYRAKPPAAAAKADTQCRNHRHPYPSE